MIRFMSRVLANDMILMETPAAVGRWLIWIDSELEHNATQELWKAALLDGRARELVAKW